MNYQQRAASICVVGSINVDTTFGVSHVPRPGETILTLRKSVGAGGKGANQAVAAASLGSKVAFLGCIGEDPDGTFVLEALMRRGVNVTNVRTVAGSATGTAMVLVAPDGENVIVVDQGANGQLESADVVAYLHSNNPAVVMAQLETNLDAVLTAAKSTHGTFILNPAPMTTDPSALAEILRYTDVLVPNRTELGRLARRATPVTISDVDGCVAELDFDGHVIVTLGKDGVAVYEAGTSNAVVLFGPVEVEAVDTSGAGDAFCGALGHELADGRDLRTAVSRANQIA
ncbi:MAG TPA: ribokinase, partial [Thermoleophilia bacterium]